MWFNDIDEDSAKLWNSVVVALHSLLQNPQNGEKISYLSYINTGRTQSMKIDDRKSNRSIDANRCMSVNWHRLVSANR